MDTIYDPLRRKDVARTPEEEVRQGVISWLHASMGVPLVRMASEWGFTYNRRKYRADLVVFDRALRPFLLVECKAPGVALDEIVLDQVVRYTRVLQVEYILVTNGTVTHLLRRGEGGGYSAAPLPESF